MFEEARDKGFLVLNPSGRPYLIPNTSFSAGMVDLTHPEACEWLKDVLREMVASGVSGWMADFGEALPFDAVLHSGQWRLRGPYQKRGVLCRLRVLFTFYGRPLNNHMPM